MQKIATQIKFENSGKIDNKIGRPSNYKVMKSSKINNGFINYLKQKLFALITNQNKEFRSDQLNAEYFRIVKKIPYYFIENWSTKNLYKESDISNCVKSYIEAASAFHFSQRNYNKTNWVERVVEFSVIFFSKVKWSKLIYELMRTDDQDLKNHLETQKTVLEIRNGMSLTNLIKFVQLSSTMRSFFEISLQVLQNIQSKINCENSNQIVSLDHYELNNGNKINKRNKDLQMRRQTRNIRSSKATDEYGSQSRKILDLFINKTQEILLFKD